MSYYGMPCVVSTYTGNSDYTTSVGLARKLNNTIHLS